jgi:hypothetical protein
MEICSLESAAFAGLQDKIEVVLRFVVLRFISQELTDH